jgi:6-phosphogluconolactonase (cycloisomerase 2 family)
MVLKKAINALCLCIAFSVLVAAPTFADSLTYVENFRENVDGVNGLDGANCVALSPDGKHVYTTGDISDAVAVFSRDSITGELEFVEQIRNVDIGVNGLNGASFVTVSPDGKHVYATGFDDDALVVLSRDQNTGELSFVGAYYNFTDANGGLDAANSVAVSPDGKHVYATGGQSNTLVGFSRNQSNGELTFVEKYSDNTDADGLGGANFVTVSPDGKHVYTTGEVDDAVVVFSRDQTNGELSFVENYFNRTDVEGLGDANSVAVSADGKSVYTTAKTRSAIVVFSRNQNDGKLSFVENHFDNLDGINGIGGASSVTVSPDGQSVYATGFDDDALAVFSRDQDRGELSFVEAQFDNSDGVNGLDGANSVAVSPDGENVYATGRYDLALVVFSRETTSRGMYVDGFKCILGNNRSSLSEEETTLLEYAQNNDIKYLALYDLDHIFGNSTREGQLNFFIVQAKSNFGILEVGAIGDSKDFFDDVIAYNNDPNKAGKFEVLSLEYDYWDDTDKTFAEFLLLLDYMNAKSNLIVETFIGEFESGLESTQARNLSQRVDRLLLSAFVTDPSFAFDNAKGRLSFLGNGSIAEGKVLEVWPVYSAEDTELGADETFMGPWLDDENNSMEEAENEFLNDYNADNSSWKDGISISGFQYFSYRYLKKLDLDDDGIADYKEDTNKNGDVDEGETDPCDVDTDGDGIQDGTELGYTISGDPDPDKKVTPDTDLSIFQEDEDPLTTTDPLDPDTDNDGLLDGEEDTNFNGKFEPERGETDPNDNPNASNDSDLPWLMLLLL